MWQKPYRVANGQKAAHHRNPLGNDGQRDHALALQKGDGRSPTNLASGFGKAANFLPSRKEAWQRIAAQQSPIAV
jgi:hypothetical protein